jgi:nucleoside 2-deoxyribosyltransferase
VPHWTAISPALNRVDGPVGRPRVFLGGPIQHLHSHENSPAVIASQREIVEALVAAGCDVLSAHEAESYGDDSDRFSPAAVTTRDLAWAKACDVYVAVLPLDSCGVPYRTDGTHIEIGWATALGRKVVLLLDDAAAKPYSHLVLGLVANRYARAVPLRQWRDNLIPCVLETYAAA